MCVGRACSATRKVMVRRERKNALAADCSCGKPVAENKNTASMESVLI